MTLLFADSFDHYAAADITGKWTSVGSAITIQAGAGRRSTNCLRMTSASRDVDKVITAIATGVVGFAVQFASTPGSATNVLEFRDTGTLHVAIRVNTDGTISALRNTTVLGSSSNALSANTWHYIEVKTTINDSTGAVEVRVNGSSTGWIALTSQDTRNGGNATFNSVRINGFGSVNYDVDDLYICDTAGSTNNNFLGDVRVDAYLPSGNGNSSQLTGSDGNSVDNYALVDESSQNSDTDYVQSSTTSQKDTYAFADMTHTPSSIFGLQVNMWAKKDDSGTRSICSVIRSGGSDTDGTTQALGTSYTDIRQISETDPNTSAAWTKTGYNSAEFGVKVAA